MAYRVTGRLQETDLLQQHRGVDLRPGRDHQSGFVVDRGSDGDLPQSETVAVEVVHRVSGVRPGDPNCDLAHRSGARPDLLLGQPRGHRTLALGAVLAPHDDT